jgi:hypothetical protein
MGDNFNNNNRADVAEQGAGEVAVPGDQDP